MKDALETALGRIAYYNKTQYCSKTTPVGSAITNSLMTGKGELDLVPTRHVDNQTKNQKMESCNGNMPPLVVVGGLSAGGKSETPKGSSQEHVPSLLKGEGVQIVLPPNAAAA